MDFQDHLVFMPQWNVNIFFEIKIIKAGLGSMCFVSLFQIFPSDNHRFSEGHVFAFSATICSRRKESSSFPTRCISDHSSHPLANVNCHPWFMFINQNGKCMWSAESGSRLLSANVINHHWLAFWVKLYKNVEKQMLAEDEGKEVRAKRLAF